MYLYLYIKYNACRFVIVVAVKRDSAFDLFDHDIEIPIS